LEFIFSKNWTWIPSSIYARKWNHNHSNSSDDDFIGPILGGMGYYRRSYKRTISNCKFIRGRFQSGILQVVMFQNVLMDPKISKEKQISLFSSMSFEIFVSFQLKKNLCVFLISYKYKYVLFHFNMLRLLQEINMFFSFFDIKLISNKNFSFRYLIQ
jgi:hypothetical protein